MLGGNHKFRYGICNENGVINNCVLIDLDDVLYEYYRIQWPDKINKEDDVRGNGRNKLRSYKLSKDDLKTEDYLCIQELPPHEYPS